MMAVMSALHASPVVSGDAPCGPSSLVVVVGASLAGLRACETLREEGFAGRIVLVGSEDHPPYDRPPLSKEVLVGKWAPERALLRQGDLGGLELDFRRGVRAEALDAAARIVTLGTGEQLAFDAMVVATGARARSLAAAEGLQGVHVLRTLDDALGLRAALAQGSPHVVVAGGGVIGCEVASTCRALGLAVTLVEPQVVPMLRLLGPSLGAVAARLAGDHGVELRLGVGIEAVEGKGRVRAVRLAGGERIACDVLVVGVGAVPETGWLEGSGLVLDDGVLCDERCLAAPGITAAGDVARWKSARAGRPLRMEHWTHAGEMGRAAALRLLRRPEDLPVFDPLPYAWSDQFGVKVQVAGTAAADDQVHVVDGSLDDYRFVALLGQGDRLSAVVGMRRPRVVMHYQELLERGARLDEALASPPA